MFIYLFIPNSKYGNNIAIVPILSRLVIKEFTEPTEIMKNLLEELAENLQENLLQELTKNKIK